MWARIASVVLGLWLMAAPAILRYGDPAQTNDRIAGPIAASVAFIAIWEVVRGFRWVNLPVGLWLVLAPWVFNYPITPFVNSTVVGLLMAALAFTGGQIKGSFGGGWSYLWSGRARGVERESDAEAA